jgi:hypothetical protein
MCPDGYYITDMKVREEGDQSGGDDTALGGLIMMCAEFTPTGRRGPKKRTVTVHEGLFGGWGAFVNGDYDT